MDRSSENISALVRSSAHPGVVGAKDVPEMARHPRRVLGVIDQNTFGAGLYPCVVNKGELQRKKAICQNTMPIPVHRPVTRASAEQVTSKRQYLYSEKKKPASLVNNSGVTQDSVIDDADEFEDACDDPVPMFVRHTEAMMDEIDSMEEVEMEDVLEDPVMDIDNNDLKNQLAVVEYVDDIYAFYRKAEDSSIVSSNYMALQVDINEKMRAILIDWLIEVHHKFNLMDETLFLTVNLIDRFLERRTESRKKLQLVGMTAMLLACKYEEVSVPLVEHFVMISDQAYTREDILDMEKLMLNTLQFNMSVPTPYVFLTRSLKAAQESENKKVELLSFFLVELCLVEYEMLKFRPSLLAASAVYTAMCSIYKSRKWSKTSEWHSKYSEDQLLECSKLMVSFHQKSGTGKLTGVHRKYNTSKLGYAARFEPAEFLLNVGHF